MAGMFKTSQNIATTKVQHLSWPSPQLGECSEVLQVSPGGQVLRSAVTIMRFSSQSIPSLSSPVSKRKRRHFTVQVMGRSFAILH